MIVPRARALVRRMGELGHVVRLDGSWNLVGIRSTTVAAGTFDDLLLALRVEALGRQRWMGHAWPITTDPGAYYLEHPLRVEGTAILCPGQYVDAWALGKHRKRYAALVQVEPVRVWRDNDRDKVLDWKGKGRGKTGIYGINIHSSDLDPFDASDRERGEDGAVGKWSAGCQVFANSSDYRTFMALVVAEPRERWTYTLIDQVPEWARRDDV